MNNRTQTLLSVIGAIRKFVQALSNVIEGICKFIAAFAVGAFVVVICMQVFSRNLFKVPMIWANDLSVVFFVWAVFFGSAIAVRHRAHYDVALFPERFAKLNCFLDILADFAGIALFYIMIRYGYDYTVMGLKRLSPSMNIPQAWFRACIPTSGCFMMWYTLLNLVSDVKKMISLLKGGKAV